MISPLISLSLIQAIIPCMFKYLWLVAVPVEREIINVYDVFEISDHTINCYKEPVNMKRLEP